MYFLCNEFRESKEIQKKHVSFVLFVLRYEYKTQNCKPLMLIFILLKNRKLFVVKINQYYMTIPNFCDEKKLMIFGEFVSVCMCKCICVYVCVYVCGRDTKDRLLACNVTCNGMSVKRKQSINTHSFLVTGCSRKLYKHI